MGRPLIPIIGRKFGKLTVVSRAKDRISGGHSEVWYRVLCDCGMTVSNRGYMIRSGRVSACKYCKPKGFKHGLWGTKAWMLWDSARNRAKELGIDFSLHPIDLIVPKNCPLLGIKIRVTNKKTSFNSPSVDRIDSTKGYNKENCWVISHRANTIKNNATLRELKMLVANLERSCPSFT